MIMMIMIIITTRDVTSHKGTQDGNHISLENPAVGSHPEIVVPTESSEPRLALIWLAKILAIILTVTSIPIFISTIFTFAAVHLINCEQSAAPPAIVANTFLVMYARYSWFTPIEKEDVKNLDIGIIFLTVLELTYGPIDALAIAHEPQHTFSRW